MLLSFAGNPNHAWKTQPTMYAQAGGVKKGWGPRASCVVCSWKPAFGLDACKGNDHALVTNMGGRHATKKKKKFQDPYPRLERGEKHAQALSWRVRGKHE